MCDVQDGRNVISCIGIYPTWKQKFPPCFYRDRNFYTSTNYKLGLTWKTKRHVELATTLHNIIWPRLGRQFHLGSRFTCLFARIFRHRIGCRNWMVWGNKSSAVYLPITKCFGSTYTETRAKGGYRSVLERKLIDKITIARVIMPVISPFVA